MRIYVFCDGCSRGFEVSDVPPYLGRLPHGFDCAGCGRHYEIRLAVVRARNDDDGADDSADDAGKHKDNML